MTKEELAKLLDVPAYAANDMYWHNIKSDTIIELINSILANKK